jgi:DNA ligase-associated metallophosphoesterase
MQAPHLNIVQGQRLWLSPDRCIFWEEEKAMILSDLHFGKTGHFRKAGIAITPQVYKEDLQRLVNQIQYFQPKKLIIVGDLFHSRENKELDLFRKWRDDLNGIEIVLIKGNHDILQHDWYHKTGISLADESLLIGDFLFRHDMSLPGVNTDVSGVLPYLFSGHIHPGILLRGMGKQSLRFPCFYFTETYCVLPAFSHFTGQALIEPEYGEHVFAIVDKGILHLKYDLVQRR